MQIVGFLVRRLICCIIVQNIIQCNLIMCRHMETVNLHFLQRIASRKFIEAVILVYEGKAKSSWTFLITFIIDVRLFSYFHKCNNGLLSTFM